MTSPRALVLWAALLLALGCSKGSVVSRPSGNEGPGGAGGSTGIASIGGGGGSGPIINVSLPSGSQPVVEVDAEVVQTKVECDGGDACKCPPFNVAVMGKPGKWGSVRNGDPPTALMDWLNSSSAGTALAHNFTDRKTLTPEFLATYNAIIFASLSDDSDIGPWWTFSADEVAAFRAWVENGGGAIFLTGYSSSNEQAPLHQLLAFSGIKINQDRVGNCNDWKICGCANANTLTDWVKNDPVVAGLSTGVTMVGFEGGHSIVAPADAHVAATVNNQVGADVLKAPALVGKLIDKGRVLVFGDEWITYTSQWTGVGNPKSSDPSCQGFLPQDKFQISQLWYNMLRWVQPEATCFTVVDKTAPTPIVIW